MCVCVHVHVCVEGGGGEIHCSWLKLSPTPFLPLAIAIGFQEENYTFPERDTGTVRLVKEGEAEIPLTVQVQLVPLTDVDTPSATEGVDFQFGPPRQFVFQPSDVSENVTIDIFSDTIFEGIEAFKLSVTRVTRPLLEPTIPETIVYILDDDGKLCLLRKTARMDSHVSAVFSPSLCKRSCTCSHT